jgi:orotidine-5'-phosphate decarboxylase
VRAIGGPIFLDLKLHDIPATVAGALGAVLPLGARFVTLHASGGAAMVAAARARAEAAGAARPRLLAVTVLTSLSAADLVGVGGDVRDQVVRLARMAIAAGADGLVCAPPEIAPLRDALGAGPVLVVPGVRPAGWAADDQARIATPAEAARAGADYVVVGRPISSAPDPAAAAAAIAAELA